MTEISIRRFLLILLRRGLLFIIPFLASGLMGQSTATITGTVTNSISGSPVTGAKIQAGTVTTWSVAGGTYTLSVPAGSYQILSTKAGFDTYSATLLNLQAGSVTTKNIQFQEVTNPPANSLAHLDTTLNPTGVTVEWEVPEGPYELLYDDGLQDDFVVWAAQGNMNAVRFTPVAMPVTITGGKVNIGAGANYPPGSNPLVPFQIAVYNDTGPGGSPGTLIGGPFDIIPTSLGWISFTFSSPVSVNGNFCLVMIQGGNAPNAAGLAVDETTPSARSYSRNTGGSGPWTPSPGNFMIRADIIGSGGPLPPLTAEPASPSGLLGYTVYRLRQGEELNPAVWTTIGYPLTEKINDLSWLSLPCGPYRWGIRANYTGNRVSPVAFSNVMGKCWTREVTVQAELSCPETPVAGTRVVMQNMIYPDTVYSAVMTTANQVNFPSVWKGTYQITTSRFGYQPNVITQSVSNDTTFQVLLLQEQTSPYDLTVNDTSLLARWRPPRPEKFLLSEDWTSGNFQSNGWTVSGGQNWTVAFSQGNPAPSAMFGYSPAVLNYSQTLTSREIQGENSAVLKLCYDFCLDNFGTTTLNQMAVELWDGNQWHTLRNYTNSGGDIIWSSQEVDISAWSGTAFRIRFRAYGEDSYDINRWNFDNIRIIARESGTVAGSCVLGYYVYLNNILCTVSTDTLSYLPPQYVQYGMPQTCCVTAIYASGPSPQVCTGFVSHYLPPPTDLNAGASGAIAQLTWVRPVNPQQPQSDPPGLIGYMIFRNGVLIDSIPDPGILQYSDTGLFPGLYQYAVSAKYDLTPYGYTGNGYSVKEGPAALMISYGKNLPFSEGWDQGTFDFNAWTAQPNWMVDFGEGNPVPSAVFRGDPVLTGYACLLESTIFNTLDVSCSKVWFDYDISLNDPGSTGTEQLIAEIFFNNSWHILQVFSNNGSFGWTRYHHDISAVMGKAFKIRFLVQGNNSQDIAFWGIDNISLYAICKAPSDLSGVSGGPDIFLNWSDPVCQEGNPMDQGFEGAVFPPAGWIRVPTNSAHTWIHTDAGIPTGVHSGNYATTLPYDYQHQDEWLIARDVLVTGDLTFWSHAFQGSVHLDHYYIKISEDHGNSWKILGDLSAMPPYPSPSGYNQWQSPYVFNLDDYLGVVVDIAWHAVDGDGQGLWYSWSVDDCSVGDNSIIFGESGGYNVFRRDPGGELFVKINADPVGHNSYTDAGLAQGVYLYYVEQASSECSGRITSDTIMVDVITGNGEEKNKSPIRVYPNPATDRINICSENSIQKISMYNISGIKCTEKNFNSISSVSIQIQNLSSGIYQLRIETETSSQIFRVIILK